MQMNINSEMNRTLCILGELLGDELLSSLLEHKLEEIMLNPDGGMFVHYVSGEIENTLNLNPQKANALVKTICSLKSGEHVSESAIVDGEIPLLKVRFSAVLPPLVRSASLCLRSLHALTIPYEKLVDNGFISRFFSELVTSLLNSKANILICGQTGSGKTTFLNALLNTLHKTEQHSRLITIEDTPELKPELKNMINLYTTKNVCMDELVKATLRLSPDRIVIGEVRGSEALHMIDALCTGHRGSLASLHAGSVKEALERLKLLMMMHPLAPEKGLEKMIAMAINAIIIIQKKPKRTVREIAVIKGYEHGEYQYESYLDNSYKKFQ